MLINSKNSSIRIFYIVFKVSILFILNMNFWNIQKLKNDLASQTINQRDLFGYYFLTGLIGVVLFLPVDMSSLLNVYQEATYEWIDWGFSSFATLLTIILCYIANEGKRGKNFIERILSIGIILIIRYLVFFVLPYAIFHGFLFEGGIYSDMSNLIATIVFESILLIRTYSCIKDIQTV